MSNLIRSKAFTLLVAATLLLTIAFSLILLPKQANAAISYPNQQIRIVGSNGLNLNIGGTTNNSVITTLASNGASNERWRLDTADGTYFSIRNMKTGKILSPLDWSLTSGTAIVLYDDLVRADQYWNFVGVDTDSNGDYLNYKIVNYSATSLALTLDTSTNRLKLGTYTGASNQKFKMYSDGLEGFAGFANDMSGAAKTGTIGGLLGEVVEVSTVSALQTQVSGSTPRTIVLAANLSSSSKTTVTVGSNKTIIGSYSYHTVNNLYFNTSSASGNVILKNLTISHDATIAGNNDIPLYITHNRNYWIDHCTFTGHSSISSSDVDKFVYVGVKADFITISHSKFSDHTYGFILGYPADTSDAAATYTGYPRMTISHNYFNNVNYRAPGLYRYGYFHVFNNYIYNYNLGFTIHTNTNIYSEKNYFNAGSLGGGTLDDYGTGYFKDVSSYPTISGQSSPTTSWTPSSNYSYSAMKAHVDDVYDTRGFTTTYAGSQSSSLIYANYSAAAGYY